MSTSFQQDASVAAGEGPMYNAQLDLGGPISIFSRSNRAGIQLSWHARHAQTTSPVLGREAAMA